MKRAIALMLCLALLLFAAAAAAEDAAGFTDIAGNRSIRTEEILLKITGSEFRDRVIGKAGIGTTLPESDKSKYFCVVGTAENVGFETVRIGNIYAEAVFNGKYRFQADVYADYEGRLVKDLDPLCEGTLLIVAKVPNKLVDIMESCALEMSFADGLASTLLSAENGTNHYRLVLGQPELEKAMEEPEREVIFFDDCPALPRPESFFDVHALAEHQMKLSSRPYTWYPFSLSGLPQSPEEILHEYYRILSEQYGFDIYITDDEDEIVLNGTTVAQMELPNSMLNIHIFSGMKKLKPVHRAGSITKGERPGKTIKLGKQFKGKTYSCKLTKTGNASVLYSTIKKPKSGRWEYFKPGSGNTIFYVLGKIKNTGKHSIDIRHIFTDLIVDGKHYECDCSGVESKATRFINTLRPNESIQFYIHTDVPKSTLKKAKSIVLKLGFTPDFTIRVIKNGVCDFTKCTDVYTLKIQ